MSPNTQKACQVLSDQADRLARISKYLDLLEKWIPYLNNVADHQQLNDIKHCVTRCAIDIRQLQGDTLVLKSSMELVQPERDLIYGPPDVMGIFGPPDDDF